MKKIFTWLVPISVFSFALIIIACSAADDEVGVCTLTDNTVATSTVNSFNCPLLTRDTSSCQSARTAQGLSGFWLKFSCRVNLTVSGSNVNISFDGLPDSNSFYFDTSDPCYENVTLSGRFANPNTIATQSISMQVPLTPATTSNNAVSGGTIGAALNGVSIYSNAAGPGDNIYDEESTFDKCDGHPQNTGSYHYHTEPSSISNQDESFLGVLRDGFPVYGRFGHGTGLDVTGLDSAGGHTSITVDSPITPVYHYHLNLQTESGGAARTAYFISAGFYAGTIGTCTGC